MVKESLKEISDGLFLVFTNLQNISVSGKDCHSLAMVLTRLEQLQKKAVGVMSELVEKEESTKESE